MKKTVLIIGISSFVGANLAQILMKDFRIVGTYNGNSVEIPGVTCYPCDVLKKDYLTKIVGLIKPDFVIYAAGLSSLTDCKLQPKLADALNSAGAINSMTAAERYKARFVYISSAYVMEGFDLLYKESDTPFPVTTYGTSMASTEFFIQRSSLNYFILRCPILYGKSFKTDKENFFEIMQRTLAKGQTFSADGSITTGFLDVTIMAEILKVCLINNVTNRLLQISSADFMTRFDFAKKYAEVFKKDPNLVHRGDVKFPVDDSPKNKDKATTALFFKLDPANIEEFLNMKMPTVEESLKVSYKRLAQY